jgi:hypothetical protein
VISKTIESFGGPFVDGKPISNPQTQVSAEKLNRALEDTAQLTRTGTRAILHFLPVAAGDPVVAYHTSVWGSGSEQWPTLTRSAVGRYSVTYPSSFTDALDYEETVSFLSGDANVIGTDRADAYVSALAGRVVSLYVVDSANSLSDLSSANTVVLWLR